MITTDGAEPADERRSAIDHEHYVQKQLRPVAEPVLQVLKRIATFRRPPGEYDPDARRRYLDRIGQ